MDAKLAGESAKVPLNILTAHSEDADAKIDTVKQLVRLNVPGDVSDVAFTITAAPDEDTSQLAHESTLRVDARPHEEV